jgi:hypothetical protein
MKKIFFILLLGFVIQSNAVKLRSDKEINDSLNKIGFGYFSEITGLHNKLGNKEISPSEIFYIFQECSFNYYLHRLNFPQFLRICARKNLKDAKPLMIEAVLGNDKDTLKEILDIYKEKQPVK